MDAFVGLFTYRALPDHIPDPALAGVATVHLPALIASAFGVSRSEGRRAITQGGVRVDGETWPTDVLDAQAAELENAVLQLGKRRFARLVVGQTT
jgi:tyrosyl-tRNA synthetase